MYAGGYAAAGSGYAAAGSVQGTVPGQNDLAMWFQAVDQDRSGRITSEELRMALVNGNNTNFSSEACRMLVKMFDTAGSGTVDFPQFQQLFQFVNQWKMSFQAYDRDRSGSIDAQELQQAFGQMGYRFSEATISAIISKYDTTGAKQRVPFDGFIIACVHIHKLTGLS